MKTRQIIWGIGAGLLGAYWCYRLHSKILEENSIEIETLGGVQAKDKPETRALMCIVPALFALGGAWGAQ